MLTRSRIFGPALVTILAVAALAMAQSLPEGIAKLPQAQQAAAQQRVQEAIKEGEVTYYDTIIQPETNQALTKAFRAYWGLPASFKVNYNLFSTSNTVTRTDEEIKSGHPTADIVSVAALPWLLDHIKNGDIMYYNSPEYAAYKPMVDRGLAEPGYFASSAYIFVPMWDPSKLNFTGTSWTDVLGAVKSGLISIGDASRSTSYLMTYVGLRQVFGVDFFKKLAAMKPVFLVRSEQIAHNLVTGEQAMAFSGMPTRAYQLSLQGANLKFMIPKEGVVLLPDSSFILAKAPHPAAAKLWLDFFLSEQGQEILIKHEALISGRSNFKSPLPKYAPPIDSLKTINVDWSKITEADLAKYRSEYESIFKPQ